MWATIGDRDVHRNAYHGPWPSKTHTFVYKYCSLCVLHIRQTLETNTAVPQDWYPDFEACKRYQHHWRRVTWYTCSSYNAGRGKVRWWSTLLPARLQELEETKPQYSIQWKWISLFWRCCLWTLSRNNLPPQNRALLLRNLLQLHCCSKKHECGSSSWRLKKVVTKSIPSIFDRPVWCCNTMSNSVILWFMH